MAKKIIVNHVQSLTIHKHLKADKGVEPAEELITRIAQEAGIEEWMSKRFVDAWRWNHREGEPEREPETYYVQTPLPIPTASTGEGLGKVAQIIALAAQGKSVAEIISLGFNKSTVYRQVGEWKKREKAAKVTA